MRAVHISELHTPPRVVDLPDTDDGLRVLAVALNPLDLAVASGAFFGGHPELPYVPGCEAVARTEDGRLVYLYGDGHGTVSNGFLAERITTDTDVALLLPADADSVQAAAIGVAGMAAWVSTVWKADVREGDRVLVLGGTGAVGQIAVQAAGLRGAAQVVAVSRTGADDTVRIHEVYEAFDGQGFTVCIDPLWGDAISAVIQHAAPRARIIHVGQSAGPDAAFRSADVRGKELTIRGHSNFALSKEERDRAYLELFEHVNAGRITVKTSTYTLDDVGSAWARQEECPREKVVVLLAPSEPVR